MKSIKEYPPYLDNALKLRETNEDIQLKIYELTCILYSVSNLIL
jgi:hypothetical protein